jgi:hypothetical protein
VWEFSTGKIRQKLISAHRDFVVALGYLANGRLVSAGGGDRAPEKAIRLWDATTKERLRQFDAATGYHTTLAVSPDRRLFGGAIETTIHVWETSSGQKINEFRGHRNHVSALAFSPDGRTLASGGADGAILFWDLTGHRGGTRLVGKTLEPAQLNSLWKELAAEDCSRNALWRLALSPKQAVPFLRQQLPAVPKVDSAHLERLISQLNADEFASREEATSELIKLGEAAAPALQCALEADPGLELKRRAQKILQQLESKRSLESKAPSASFLRMLRAIEVLERAGTPEATEVLRDIAEGEPAARLTKEAQAALKRLQP